MSSAARPPSEPSGRALRERAAQDELAPLYGRETEQAALLHMMTRLAAGHAGVTVIHGVPGSGRSRLLRRGMSFARAAGVQVLTALGSASSSRTSYGFVEQARPRATAHGAGQDAERSAEALVAGWCRGLLSAAHRPTLLALDDVQWADPESVRVISGLLRRLGSAPLGVLLTVTSARGEFPDACASLVDQAAFSQDGRGVLLELGPLGAREVRAMSEATGLPAPAAPDSLWWERAAQLSQGSPRLLRRILDELRREPGTMSAAALRTAFARHADDARAELAAESAAPLAEGPLALLRGLCVCRGLVPVDRVAAVVGLDEAELPGALRALRVQGLIDFGDPPRPALTDRTTAVLAGLRSDERRRLHAEAARWAHRCDAAEEDLAPLLLDTVPLGDPWVPAVLRHTARHRLACGRHAEAAEYLERALREPLVPVERAEVLLEAAEAYAMTAPEASELRIAELLSGAEPRPRLRAATADLVLARGEPLPAPADLALWWDGGGRRAEPPTAEDSGPRAVSPHGTVAPAARTGAAGHVPAAPETPPAALAVAAWQKAMRSEDACAVREMCRQVLRAPLDGPLFPRFTACRVLSLADAHGTARTALDVTLAEAGQRGSPALVASGLLLRAQLNLRACDAETATHDLAACRSLVPPAVWDPARLAALRAAQIRVLLARECYEEADRLAAEEPPPGAEESTAWIELLYSRAQVLLCQGHPRRALAEAEECGRRLAARGWLNPALLAWRSLAALAHLGCGEEDRAAALFAEELRLAEHWGTDSAPAWTELRRSLGTPAPQAARFTERALRRLGRTPAARRLAQALVVKETAGLHRRARAGTASPASAPAATDTPMT
ncbi:hypothetical protein AQJ66_25415 [Streptomyces bungoensis]|uniref:Orc1-like AAA ATPase domain-containing protein n=1 Tax=Streptomyces bungoensis TaxID=285568 RepID=A0A101SVK6_9ACTN|nr:ATP-binding protein [Streptomyces bungoensis]KUN81009.1 hypothetical protein AQJ66_25415 [Streptomyces bungoensis]